MPQEWTRKEIYRLEALALLARRAISVRDAELMMQLKRSQVLKLLAKYKKFGPDCIPSLRRNRPSNRNLPPSLRRKVIEAIRDHYSDFGPTLACEMLAEHHRISLGVETVRRWMIDAGLWAVCRVSDRRIHRRRDRHPCFGGQIQLDGSKHDWFEGRANTCVLMVAIDDATSAITNLHFSKQETTEAYFRIVGGHITQHGRPIVFVTDQHRAVYIEGKVSHFEAAMTKLAIGHSVVRSAQAKGRVERVNRTLQNRLVKAMRLAGICSIDEANQFAVGFLPKFNAKFAKQPISADDLHRPLSADVNLNEVLCIWVERKVSRSLTFQIGGKLFQILGHRSRQLALKRIWIKLSVSGPIEAFYGDSRQVIELVAT
jgi:hypothetical protein